MAVYTENKVRSAKIKHNLVVLTKHDGHHSFLTMTKGSNKSGFLIDLFCK